MPAFYLADIHKECLIIGGNMGKMIFFFIIGLILVISRVLPCMAETGVDSSGRTTDKIEIVIENRKISVELTNKPLGLILRQLEEKGNIWSKGGERILKEKVSVSFKGLSLEEGLKRILSRVNYSLVFDKGGALTGMIIAGRSKTDQSPYGGRAVTAGKALNSMEMASTPVKKSIVSVADSPPRFSSPRAVFISKKHRVPRKTNEGIVGKTPILKNRMSDQ
jgi:hypothetical protein